MDKRTRQLIKNIFVLGFGTLLPKFTSLLTLPILTGVLSQLEYGSFDLISTMTSLFLPLATMQTHVAVFRFLIDEREDANEMRKIVSSFYFFVIPTSFFSIVVLYLVLHNYSFNIRLSICVLYLLELHFSCLQQICRGMGKNRIYSEGTVIQSIVQLSFLFISLKLYVFGLLGALYSLSISYCIASIYFISRIHVSSYLRIRYIEKSVVYEMLSYSWPMIPESLAFWILSFSDRALISLFLGVEMTAIYAVATKIPSLLSLFRNVFSYAWQENASISAKDEDASKYYSTIFEYFYRLLAGGTALLISSYPLIYKILVRGDYADSLPHIPILLLGTFFSMVASYLAGIYVAKKNTKSIGITTIFAALINCGIDILFIKSIGIYAASLSTLIGFAFLAVYRMINVNKIQPFMISWRLFLTYVFILGILMVISYISIDSIYILLANIITASAFFTIINASLIKKITRV